MTDSVELGKSIGAKLERERILKIIQTCREHRKNGLFADIFEMAYFELERLIKQEG